MGGTLWEMLPHSGDKMKVSVLPLVRWPSSRLQHLPHQVEADWCFALILRNGEGAEKVQVAQVGAAVAVLVYRPRPLGGVGVAPAGALGCRCPSWLWRVQGSVVSKLSLRSWVRGHKEGAALDFHAGEGPWHRTQQT